MQAGDLRNRIEIQRLKKEPDENNITKVSYYPLKTVWAKANGLFGKEYWTAKEYGAENTVEFTIRHNACRDLSTQDRIVFLGQIYNIVSVDNVLFQNKFLKIKAYADLTEGGGAT